MNNYLSQFDPAASSVENIFNIEQPVISTKNQYLQNEIPNQKDLQIKEITKLADKAKWNARFYKSYAGEKVKASPEMLVFCRFFLAIYKGNEAGYIRIFNYTSTFANFYSGEVWTVNEGYTKPPYRSKGILTALRAYVVKHCNVKLMRIETDRFFKLQSYYKSQGFLYGYPILEGYLSIICVPEFLDALYAYSKFHTKH